MPPRGSFTWQEQDKIMGKIADMMQGSGKAQRGS